MTDSSKPVPADTSARDYLRWWNALMSDDALRKMAGKGRQDLRLTAITVATGYGTWGRECRPRAATVAGRIGCDEKTVRLHLAALVEAGWLTRRKRPGTTDVYAIAIPDPGHLDARPTPGIMMPDDTNETPSNEKPLRRYRRHHVAPWDPWPAVRQLPGLDASLPLGDAARAWHEANPGHPVHVTESGTVACFRCGIEF